MVAECFVQCRVSAEIKSALQAAAQEQGVSESVIVKRLLQSSLGARHLSDQAILRKSPRPARKGRLTIRLRPDDALLLQARAEARAMAAATYASVALRAHLKGTAPIPKAELELLRRALRDLGLFRDEMRRHAYHPVTPHFLAILKICECLRDSVSALLEKNLRSWQ
jgi:predicted HicB family RNase H-like nuclease